MPPLPRLHLAAFRPGMLLEIDVFLSVVIWIPHAGERNGISRGEKHVQFPRIIAGVEARLAPDPLPTPLAARVSSLRWRGIGGFVTPIAARAVLAPLSRISMSLGIR